MIIGNTFNETFNNYKAHFIREHGVAKFDRAYDEVTRNSKLKQMLQWSRSNQDYLGGGDYSNLINSIFYFMFKGNETTVLGILIAIKHWNEIINSYMMLCPDVKVNEIASDQLHRYCFGRIKL